jgi:hypothetical protein
MLPYNNVESIFEVFSWVENHSNFHVKKGHFKIFIATVYDFV